MSVNFSTPWCHQECSLVSELWGCGVPEIVPWHLLTLPIAPSKPQLIRRSDIVPLITFYIINNRSNFSKEIAFVFQERNFSVVFVGFLRTENNLFAFHWNSQDFLRKMELDSSTKLAKRHNKLGCQIIPLNFKTYECLFYRHHLVIVSRPVKPYIVMK